MQLPTIHLNGTPKRMLLENLEKASQSLELAYQDLKQTSPNARDFYPQEPGAMWRAVEEHSSRLRRLDDVKKEVDALIVAIDRIGT